MKVKKFTDTFSGIKRWIFLIFLGMILFISGVVFIISDSIGHLNISIPVKIMLIVVGIVFVSLGSKNALSNILDVTLKYKNYNSYSRGAINQMLYMDKIQSQGPKIVAIGGGTGLSTLLRGLKKRTGNITAIVTVADDGGGSGVLREEMGIIPPGDIRNCIMALAHAEPSMDKLLNYRFKEGRLKGQSFGNLFIAAMDDIYGDFNLGVKEMSNVLAVRGNVLPMTKESVKLFAELDDGKVIEGESQIPEICHKCGKKISRVYTVPDELEPLQESIEAIEEADCIVLGPGSLYTSIIPNLLVEDLVKAIKKSKAKKIYISNIMTQPGETTGYTLTDHINAIEKHAGGKIIDFVIANNPDAKSYSRRILRNYMKEDSELIDITDEEKAALEKRGITVYTDSLVEIRNKNFRHSDKVSDLIMKIYLYHSQKIYER